MQVQYSVIIGLCRRDLKLDRPPNPGELSDWSKRGKGRGIIDLDIEQANHLLANPTKYFGEEANP